MWMPYGQIRDRLTAPTLISILTTAWFPCFRAFHASGPSGRCPLPPHRSRALPPGPGLHGARLGTPLSQAALRGVWPVGALCRFPMGHRGQSLFRPPFVAGASLLWSFPLHGWRPGDSSRGPGHCLLSVWRPCGHGVWCGCGLTALRDMAPSCGGSRGGHPIPRVRTRGYDIPPPAEA
jgi:hypothetical protein